MDGVSSLCPRVPDYSNEAALQATRLVVLLKVLVPFFKRQPR